MNRLASALARIGLGLMIVCVTLVSSGSSANATEEKYVQLVSGDLHTCGVLVSGSVKCWGANQQGQLVGYGSQSISSPTLLPGLTGVKSLALGAGHSCAVLVSGLVKCWGSNLHGELGYFDPSTNTPPGVPMLVSGLKDVSYVVSGGYHSCAVLVSGSVKCWGYDHYGQLGLGYTSESAPYVVSSPTLVPGLTGVVSLALGYLHSCALLVSGSVKCWGQNGHGQLGLGDFGESVLSPTLVPGLTDVASIVLGSNHSCAVLVSGSVKCWGTNSLGELGLGYTSAPVSTPTLVTGLTDVASLGLGWKHSCAVLVSGAVKCWGQSGLLGWADTGGSVSSPTSVPNLTDAKSLVLGEQQTCAVLVSGSVKCWGANHDGQLGLGYTDGDVSSPTVVPEVVLAHAPAAPNITSIVPSAGALTFTGTAPNNGGSKITDYQYTLDGGATWFTANPRVTSSPYKLTGLANGTTYRVQVRAVNTVGVGAATAVVVVSMPRG